MIRSFVALELPDATLDMIEAMQDKLPSGRIVARDNLHLTLAFMGERRAEEIDELCHCLALIRARRFRLRLSGLEFLGQGRALAAGVTPEPLLVSLHEKVRRAARQATITLARERFRPHVTLARFSQSPLETPPGALVDLVARSVGFTTPQFPVESFHLFQSVLHHDGPVHRILASFPLE